MKRVGFGVSPAWLVLAGLTGGVVSGCGVVNPSLVAVLPGGTQTSTMDSPKGQIVILVINLTPSTTQANVLVTKTNGGQVTLNIAVPAFAHRAFTQECEVQKIEFVQASYAGATGAVQIPFTVSPLVSGVNLECGNVVAISMLGTAPNIAPQIQVY